MDKNKTLLLISFSFIILLTLIFIFQTKTYTIYKHDSNNLAIPVDSQPPSFDIPRDVPSEIPEGVPEKPKENKEPYMQGISLEGMVVGNGSYQSSNSSTPLKVYLPTTVLKAGNTIVSIPFSI